MPKRFDDPIEDVRHLCFGEVLRAELAAILPDVGPSEEHPRTKEATETYTEAVTDWVDSQAQASPLTALCLSGGGIRSASFALGVLQALARAGVLGHFHYLSTVSGGGYIGAWLTAFRKHAGDDKAVFAALNQLAAEGRDPPQIANLRANSNYLTPRLGILSADTWAVIASYVRNLVLNWLVFGPLFLAVLIVPQLCARLLSELAVQPVVWVGRLQWIAGIALLIGLSVSVCGRLRTRGQWLTDRWYLIGVILPVVIAAMSLTGIARIPREPGSPLEAAIKGASVYACAALLGWCLAKILPGDAMDRTRPGAARSWGVGETLAYVMSGAVVGLLLSVGCDLATFIRGDAPIADRDALLVVFGESWVVLSILTGDMLYTGLASYAARGDMDQEWLARSAGWMAAVALTWAIVAAIDLYGPFVFDSVIGQIATVLAGGVSGVIALAFGGGAKTAATVARQAVSKLSFNQLIGLAAVVFGVFLAILLAWVDARICGYLFDFLRPLPPVPFVFPSLSSCAMGALAVGLALLALAISVPVNVNRFSLHGVYRNRLIRAFLGSARAGLRRCPDPFTGFDPTDNMTMSDTLSSGELPRRLFHVVNVALNIVGSRKLAWQERKAEAFSMTALACGNPTVGYRCSRRYGAPGGVTLGTATAISGAAVSPNEGYHSSTLVGFLLMLFNLRLGWWLGNPRHASVAHRSGPRIGLIPALQELAGATTDDKKWIYLSDGGHFDNLGIYEMVRRRCRLIVVSDAGCDPDTRLEDLGNAVRKCFIDFGVRIDFDRLDLPARPVSPDARVYCAIGRVIYPGNGPAGWLLYVKPAYHGTEPADIRSYALAHPEFPHETTADQWFAESQFEAYRSLGEYIFDQICGRGLPPNAIAEPLDLARLKDWAESYVARGGPAKPPATT